MNKDIVVSCKQLKKSYTTFAKQGGFMGSFASLFHRKKITIEALHPTDLTITQGEIVGLLGPNGAGKTTLIKLLTGIIHPTDGTASVFGFTPWKRHNDYLKQIALVMGQKNQLWWDLPPIDTYLLHKHIYEIPEATYNETLNELMTMLEVKEIINTPTRKLSLGQRMKCELIAALLHNPQIIFLDEPTLGLDVVSQKNIRDFLLKYNKKTGATILLTSHYMEDIKELCKRVVIIHHGKLMIDTSYQELIAKYETNVDLEITFKKAVNTEELKQFGTVVWQNGNNVMVTLSINRNDKAKVVEKLFKTYEIANFTLKEKEASEVIREIFGTLE
jgi:ABC-2 type transport system ATP-binding protein